MHYRRDKAGRRGRRVLLWLAACYCVAQLGAGLLLDYRWPEVRFPSAFGILATLRAWERSPDIIFFGSSRLGTDFPPEILNQAMRDADPGEPVAAFNASVPAGDFISDDFLLEHFLREGIRPAVAVIEISPEMVARRNDWLQMHVARQFRWEDVPFYFTDLCRSRQLARLFTARFSPLYLHRREIWNRASIWATHSLLSPAEPASPEALPAATRAPALLLREKARRVFTLTSARLERQPDVDWQTLIAKSSGGVSQSQAERTEMGLYGPRKILQSSYEVGGASTLSLERLLARCRDHGIVPILLGVPISTRHRELYTPEIETRYQGYIAHVVGVYHCRFVDYRDQVPDRLFLDNHHLNDEGGVYFSQRFCREVIAPLVHAFPLAAN